MSEDQFCPLCEWKGNTEECDFNHEGIPVCPICGYSDLEEIKK